MGRYTPFHHRDIDQIIDHDLQLIVDALKQLPGNYFKGLILGGGYGKGEGGFFLKEKRPFNDYDLFLFTDQLPRYLRPLYQYRIKKLIASLGEQISVEIDISKPINIDQIKKLPHTLMFTELKAKHIVLYGPQNLFTPYRWSDLETLPLIEAPLMMVNRGAGVLMALLRWQRSPLREAPFIIRNFYKGIIAAGDALLILHHRYHHSYKQRLKRLKTLTSTTHHNHYRDAINFKFSPMKTLPPENIEQLKQNTLTFFQESYEMIMKQYQNDHHTPQWRRLITTERVSSPYRLLKNVQHLKRCSFQTPNTILFYLLPYFLFGAKGFRHIEICNLLSIKGGAMFEEQSDAFLKLWRRSR